MDTLQALLTALHADPGDDTCWLALADCLEESGEPARATFLRLRLCLQNADLEPRRDLERRMQQMLFQGLLPAFPEMANSIGMRLVLMPAGTFWMGSPHEEPGRHADEAPRHRVTLRRPFYLGVHPVTQAQYQRVMGVNPSHFRDGGPGAASVRGLDTATFPVESISWHDATLFCHRLSELPAEKSAGRSYRLPTEAEWEYACRAGTTTLFHFGDALSSDLANIDGNLPEGTAAGVFLGRTCTVGSYVPNGFGLYDMHGNVWEWCLDWFDENYYPHSPLRDPAGPPGGTRRSLRGGGWYYGARICRSAYRYRYEPDIRHHDFGMRVAMTHRGGT